MKSFALSSSTLVILLFAASAFSQDPTCERAKPKLAESRNKLQETFRAKDYDKAYKIANEMVSMGEADCGSNDAMLLVLYMNVAQIQINRKNFDEARKIYDERLELAEKVYGSTSADFQKYTEDLLKLSIRKVGTEQFEGYALKLLEAKKNRFGENSSEFLSELTRMARFYAAWKKPEIAEKYFFQAMDVADKLPPEMASAKRRAVTRYRIFLIRRYGEAEGLKRDAAFMQQRYPDFENEGGVLNGYAYSLPRASYSDAARNMGASGEVSVSITIDQRGRVVSATATSGHPLFRSNAETAAKAAKFLPTYFKGKPVEIRGVLIYLFSIY